MFIFYRRISWMRTYKTQWVASRFKENIWWTLTNPRILPFKLITSSSYKARPIYVLQTVDRIKEGDIYNAGLLFGLFQKVL